MTDHDQWANYLDPDADASDVTPAEQLALDRIGATLAGSAVWAGPSPDVRERLLDQVIADTKEDTPVIADETDGVVERSAEVIDLGEARRARRGLTAALAGIAGAVAAAVALTFVVPRLSDNGDATTYEVAGTALTPDLDATVDVDPQGAGVAITLNIAGLPPAGEGEYYAAWLMRDDAMSDGDVMSDDEPMAGSMADSMVGIGSFHWREGGIPIELWSGVDTDRYPVFVVTLQDEDDPPTASDRVVMTGRLTAE